MKRTIYIFQLLLVLIFQNKLNSQTSVKNDVKEVFDVRADGSLKYVQDEKGNRLPDFSYVGYHMGEKALPDVPIEIILKPSKGDNTQIIQDALDKIGTLKPNANGHRGALLLKEGTYHVEGTITINKSGIVLRGEGNGPNGTVLVAKGFGDFKYRRTLIRVGNSIKIKLDTLSMKYIKDEYVPIGTHTFTVRSSKGYKVGDSIVVYRPSTKKWIHSIGCDTLKSKWSTIKKMEWVRGNNASIINETPLNDKETYVRHNNKKRPPGFYYQRIGYDTEYVILKKENETWEGFQNRVPISSDGKKFDLTRQWETGDYDLYFERRITSIKDNQITIDAPIVHAIDTEFGGGSIFHYKTPERVNEVGIENIRIVSEFAKPTRGNPYGSSKQETKSELHGWNGIVLNENTVNTWVRDITGNYFGWSLVSAKGKNATIQDCVNLGHASEITGGRRYSFMINGQLNLVQRCVAFEGRHEFVNQERTLGPNVFVDCIGFNSKQNSGPHHRYAVGNLYDNISSEQPMESRFRGNSGTGHGWAGTQTCFYNCVAPQFHVDTPSGGISWLIGTGQTIDSRNRVKPPSLYYQQVQDRLGKTALQYLMEEAQLKYMGEYRWVKYRLINEGEKYKDLKL